MKIVVATLLFVLVLVAGAGVLFIYSGVYNVSAVPPHHPAARWVLTSVMERSVRRRAGRVAPPEFDDAMVDEGFRRYRGSCEACHGPPGGPQPAMGKGLRPTPPDLSRTAGRWSRAELYWIVDHGIRMTGMPAWSDVYDEDALWSVVAFVEQMPTMTPEAYQQRVDASRDERTQASQDGGADERAPDDAARPDHVIDMTDSLEFAPERLMIQRGDTVRWDNTSAMMHTVTADAERASDADHVVLPDGAEPFDSGAIQPGERFQYTFDVPGSYRYVCVPHEAAGMIGEIDVQ